MAGKWFPRSTDFFFSIWLSCSLAMETLSFMCPVLMYRQGQTVAKSHTVQCQNLPHLSSCSSVVKVLRCIHRPRLCPSVLSPEGKYFPVVSSYLQMIPTRSVMSLSTQVKALVVCLSVTFCLAMTTITSVGFHQCWQDLGHSVPSSTRALLTGCGRTMPSARLCPPWPSRQANKLSNHCHFLPTTSVPLLLAYNTRRHDTHL